MGAPKGDMHGRSDEGQALEKCKGGMQEMYLLWGAG
jgi:hypothetical protein